MATPIEQILSVLSFNQYYLFDRLRERYSGQQLACLLQKIKTKYDEELSQNYEVLCLVGVREGDELVFTYDTQTNLNSGKVNIYQGGEIVQSYPTKQVQEVHMVAIYHKTMSFDSVVALVKEKRTPTAQLAHKFHEKHLDRVLQATHCDTLTNPSPNPVPNSCFSTPVKNALQNERGGDGISKKILLLDDDDDSEQDCPRIVVIPQDSNKKQQLIRKLRQEQYKKISNNRPSLQIQRINSTQKKKNQQPNNNFSTPSRLTPKKNWKQMIQLQGSRSFMEKWVIRKSDK